MLRDKPPRQIKLLIHCIPWCSDATWIFLAAQLFLFLSVPWQLHSMCSSSSSSFIFTLKTTFINILASSRIFFLFFKHKTSFESIYNHVWQLAVSFWISPHKLCRSLMKRIQFKLHIGIFEISFHSLRIKILSFRLVDYITFFRYICEACLVNKLCCVDLSWKNIWTKRRSKKLKIYWKIKCRHFSVLPWIPAYELSFDCHFHLLLSHLKKR